MFILWAALKLIDKSGVTLNQLLLQVSLSCGPKILMVGAEPWNRSRLIFLKKQKGATHPSTKKNAADESIKQATDGRRRRLDDCQPWLAVVGTLHCHTDRASGDQPSWDVLNHLEVLHCYMAWDRPGCSSKRLVTLGSWFFWTYIDTIWSQNQELSHSFPPSSPITCTCSPSQWKAETILAAFRAPKLDCFIISSSDHLGDQKSMVVSLLLETFIFAYLTKWAPERGCPVKVIRTSPFQISSQSIIWRSLLASRPWKFVSQLATHGLSLPRHPQAQLQRSRSFCSLVLK